MKTHAITFPAAGEVALAEVQIPDPGPGEVLLRTLFSTVSPGTELRVFNGTQVRMPPYPVIPGYTATAEVVATGPGATLAPGTRVYAGGGSAKVSLAPCWGAHVAHSVRAEAGLFPLPSHLEALPGSVVKLAAIAYRGVRLALARPHETVVVVGLGPIGQLSARLFRTTGARVIAADRVASRVATARAAGIDAVAVTRSLADDVAPLLDGGAHVVVDATGAAPVLSEAITLGRRPAWDDLDTTSTRIVVQGSYAGEVPVDYDNAFVCEAQLLFPRDQRSADVRAVLDLMGRGHLRVDDLFTAVLAPHRAAEGYAQLRARDTLLVSFDWSQL
jgi:3-hydroxyethyl bacteriochlorophyllide a dehydrogenase